jgi:3-isopropylmalate/(R)-2-methylmalate dehydratase large subunit
MSTTLFDKVWDSHVVRKIEDGPDVFFYWSPFHSWSYQSCFLGLKERGISVLYPERTLPLPITTHQL